MTFQNPYDLEEKVQTGFRPVLLQPNTIEKVDLSPLEEMTKNNDSDMPSPGFDAKAVGDKIKGNAADIVQFGVNRYNDFKTISPSSDASTAQTIKTGVEGAALGLKIGGPVGAIAGGLLGTGLGMIDSKSDKRKRIEALDNQHREMLEDRKAKRKRDYQLSQGKQASNAEYGIMQNQSKFINRY